MYSLNTDKLKEWKEVYEKIEKNWRQIEQRTVFDLDGFGLVNFVGVESIIQELESLLSNIKNAAVEINFVAIEAIQLNPKTQEWEDKYYNLRNFEKGVEKLLTELRSLVV
ncbi:hypothetical protein [Aneurinibacillus tyrosinisolvens]|uniref:hypothetical protein n=1 Tax=Aneurinibacillus tyrosinisolvens TaxID=1443435 RepID=UPI00063EE0CF|nr:hypothetical protein [Aneurinibacillus tyrosinisolvens]